MNPNINLWYGRSDRSFLEMIGQFLRNTRLNQNKTQDEIAAATGLNRSTIIQLEKGAGGTLLSLVQVLRALNVLEVLQSLEVSTQISPLLVAEMEKKQRRRARKQKPSDIPDSDW